MIRTYCLKHSINSGKQNKILALVKLYRKLAVKLANLQWLEFFQNGGFNKNLDIKAVKSQLSERYKQTCQYQVVGVLNSFISNRQNDFVNIVCKSSLHEKTKLNLFYINKYKLWFKQHISMPAHDKQGKKIKDKYEEIKLQDIKLARTIFKHVLSKHKKPKLKHCNMALDQKVAKVSAKEKSEKNKASKFDYWVKLSTLQPRKQIDLPLSSNKFFNDKQGIIKKFCQINVNENKEIKICLIKDVDKPSYVAKTPKISLDFGLRNLFVTNNGDLYGRNFIDILKKYDQYITSLAKNRQRQKLKVRSSSYDSLVGNLRSFLKNEINRVINNIIEQYQPKEIVIENLNFTCPRLSRRMNRLLSNMGSRIIGEKFESVKEQYSIIITPVHAAYTSKECSNCGYVDEKNRKSQSIFVCRHCHKKMNADANAAKNIFLRSSEKDLANIYLSKSAILDKLIEQFLIDYPNFKSIRPDLVETNPYFKKYLKHDNKLQYG